MRRRSQTYIRPGRAFTLIELLVVISIIGLLATVATISLANSRLKTNDARKQSDFKNIQTALYLFYDQNGRMPLNFNAGYSACETDGYYEQSMQEMIDAGVLGKVPKSPAGLRYCYYDYGSGNEMGAMMVTVLQAAPPSISGLAPSCRPWAGGTNWCDKRSTQYYCLCSPY